MKKAIIFGWTGTVIDFGSRAPVLALAQTLAEHDIDASESDICAPMGLAMWDHVAEVLHLPSINTAWVDQRGRAPSAEDVEAVYQSLLPKLEDAIADHSTLVPGARETLSGLRARGYKIGATTAYPRSIIEPTLPSIGAQGFSLDTMICSDDLAEARPGPLVIYQCLVDMAVYPTSSVIKVASSVPGIAEGIAAGCMTIGVALSGHYAGQTPEDIREMDDSQIASLRERAVRELMAAGAHHVIDTVADLPDLLERL
ncbi:UNVERIFIED_CONTAM: hypothetical protein GTU68_038097 [Idotea baltica]|nr:hypothetical protein [Idotea baltica]